MDAVLNASMLPGNVVKDPDEYRFGSCDIINPLSIVSCALEKSKKLKIQIKGIITKLCLSINVTCNFIVVEFNTG